MKIPSCVICDCALISDIANVGNRGQRKLVWASSMRNDGKFHEVSENTIHLHCKCRSKYTNEKSVLAAAKRIAKENREICYIESLAIEWDKEENTLDCSIQSELEKQNTAEENSKKCYIESSEMKMDPESKNINNIKNDEKKINSAEGSPQCYIEIAVEKSTSIGETNNEFYIEIKGEQNSSSEKNIDHFGESTIMNSNSTGENNTMFDYDKHCLFCATDASDDFIREQIKKAVKKRILVYKVSKRQTADNILCYCLYSDSNEMSKRVRSRVENKDLVSLSARYHKVCYTKFMTLNPNKPTPGKKGRPLDLDIQNQMQIVYHYIDNYLEDDVEYSVHDIKKAVNVEVHSRTMHDKLKKHYGDAIDVGLPNNRIRMRRREEDNLLEVDDSIVPEAAAAAAAGAGVEEVGPGNALHTGYRCDSCQEDIIGFRYACVECANFDLCGACEARAQHALHYVLRVPADKLHVEVQAILDNIRNVLLKRGEDSSSEPEVKVEEPEQSVDLDPLATPDDCHYDVSEEQSLDQELSSFLQTDEIEQSTTEDDITVAIQTEPIGKHRQVALYTQLKTGPEESQETSFSRLMSGLSSEERREESSKPIGKQRRVALYTQLKTGPEESQETSFSRLKSEPISQGTQNTLSSQCITGLSSEPRLIVRHLKTESSSEETQKASHSGLRTVNEDSREASCSRIESGNATASYMESSEKLRAAHRTYRAERPRTGPAAGGRFAVCSHWESREGTSQGVPKKEEEREQSSSATKRKSTLKLILSRPKIKK